MSLLRRSSSPSKVEESLPVATQVQRVQVIGVLDNKVKSTTTEDDPCLPAIRASNLYRVVKI